METCINDVVLVGNGQTIHEPIVARAQTNEALVALADILEETKGHIGAANHFPMWMCSLVGYYPKQTDLHIRYQFIEERNIDLCQQCERSIWNRIANFKEDYPELFMPDVKEPEFD